MCCGATEVSLRGVVVNGGGEAACGVRGGGAPVSFVGFEVGGCGVVGLGEVL